MITEEQLNKAISDFSKNISSQELGLVYYRPDPTALATDCISNVISFQSINGGMIKYGWTFHHRISMKFGEYLFATHHAVWLSPDGSLIDITPFHNDSKHHPIIEDGDVLFLLDDNAQPIRIGNVILPLPLRYYAIQKEPKLVAYVLHLQKKEYQYYKKNFGISFEGS